MKYILTLSLFLTFFLNATASPQQRMQDFYLSSYKEDGVKNWEIRGAEAHIFDDYVDIEGVKAKCYEENDVIDIEADKAKLKQKAMNVHLRENVEITSKQGVTLNTDYLIWERDKNKMKTNEWVKVKKEDSMEIEATGMEADTQIKQADFKEDVKVNIPQEDGRTMVVTCDGPLEIDYQKSIAVFKNNVEVEDEQGKLFCDRATVFFDPEAGKMKSVVAEGNVKIIKDENVTFAEKATYFGDREKVVLEGRPRLVIFTQEEE